MHGNRRQDLATPLVPRARDAMSADTRRRGQGPRSHSGTDDKRRLTRRPDHEPGQGLPWAPAEPRRVCQCCRQHWHAVEPAQGSSLAKWTRQPSGRWASRVSRRMGALQINTDITLSRTELNDLDLNTTQPSSPLPTSVPAPADAVRKPQQRLLMVTKMVVSPFPTVTTCLIPPPSAPTPALSGKISSWSLFPSRRDLLRQGAKPQNYQ